MKEITKKEMTSSIGLIISCDDCNMNNRIQQRMERMNQQPKQQFDFERESQRFQRRQRPNPNDTHRV
jgi:hypothetical protein